ncbi:MAG: O-antigen ligase family protein, partial [Aeriscardovia sp.]|nr:O-antigen ligase family protein [Aeriscardovia sp.]
MVVRNFVFLYFLYLYVLKTGSQKFLKVLTITSCIASLGVLLIFFINTGSFYLHDEDSLGIINANIQSVIDGFVIAWLIVSKKYKGKYLYAILFLFVFILLSGTRKSIITIAVIVGGFMMLRNAKNILRNAVIVLILFVALYFILMKIPAVYDMIGNRFESLFSFMEGGDTDDSTKTRDRFIEYALLFWADSPIWGNGLNSFGILYGIEDTYSHNNYVELLCSVGLVGMVSYYLMYLFSLFKLITIKKNREIFTFTVCLIISILLKDYALVS